jgi:hypothetical protein
VVGPPAEDAKYSALRLMLVVVSSAVAALVTTLLTKPEPTEHLLKFYRRVRPPAFGWGPIAKEAGDVGPTGIGREVFGQAALALYFVFAGMIGLGKVLLGEVTLGVALVASAAVAGWFGIRWVFAKPAGKPVVPTPVVPVPQQEKT